MMKQKKPARRLTVAEAAAGAYAAYRNAQDLFDDARCLYAANRNARAAALFILAIEETGKPAILACIAATANDDDAKRRELWQRYRRHEAKNVAGAWHFAMQNLEVEFRGKEPPDDPLGAVFRDGPERFEQLKQAALYVGVDDQGNWTMPRETVRWLLAMRVSDIAASCVQAAEKNPVIHERGMALWVQHVGPAFRAGTGFGDAFRTYHSAVVAAGLAEEGSVDPALFEHLG